MMKLCFSPYADGTKEATNNSKSLETSVFVLSSEMVESSKFSLEIICLPRHVLRLMARHCNDTTDALCNARFFGDDKILNVTGLCDMAERV